MAISSRRDSNKNLDNTFTFDTTISTRGGELNISFNIVFLSEMKLNMDAPQGWKLTLPANTGTADALTGRLPTPVSVKFPEGEAHNKFSVALNIIACTADTCLPKKLFVVFNVHRSADAPIVVTEEKELVVQ